MGICFIGKVDLIQSFFIFFDSMKIIIASISSGKRPLGQFLSSYIDLTPGNFVDIDTGKVLCFVFICITMSRIIFCCHIKTVGIHKGKELYTIGQCAKIPGIGPKDKKYANICNDDLSKETSGDMYR